MFTIQEIILNLQKYWYLQGCVLIQPYDLEIGAGTFHTSTFLYSLNSKLTNFAFIQMSRRPKDSKNTKNPIKLQQYYQYQVIFKPCPNNIIDLYINSLITIGINLKINDIRFIEDNWENQTLGSWGLGWEIWLNGIEITQFTYFQQMGGINCNPTLVEITYGIERIAINLQQSKNIYNLIWSKFIFNLKCKNIYYKDLFLKNEIEQSKFNFKYSNKKLLFLLFNKYIIEIKRLLNLFLILPAYELLLKTIHIFNLLDARRVISNFEKINYINNIRNLSCLIAKKYLKSFKN